MMNSMASEQKHQPDPERLMRLVRKTPHVLNAYLAYFYFEWQEVHADKEGLHGRDASGMARRIPNYVSGWGIELCLELLTMSPKARAPHEPGGLSTTLELL